MSGVPTDILGYLTIGLSAGTTEGKTAINCHDRPQLIEDFRDIILSNPSLVKCYLFFKQFTANLNNSNSAKFLVGILPMDIFLQSDLLLLIIILKILLQIAQHLHL